jgi:Domain of unknown function (DUF4129)
MLAFRFAIALLLICLFLGAAAASDSGNAVLVQMYPPRALSFAEYVSELDYLTGLAGRTDKDPTAAAGGLAELRGGWKVQAGGREFAIPTGEIFDQFEKLQKHPDNQIRVRLLERLAALKTDAQGFQQLPPDVASSRAALNEILSRREFHQVQGPTWLDRLKFKIQQWIFQFLSNLFGSSSAPVAGKILVWSLVSIAVLVLAFFVYRTMKQNARLETIMPEVLPVSAKKWSLWMAEAQAAAAKGLWRDAVHLAYWAGISFLEESGMWRPDQARTPREYLKLIPASSEHRPALSTLTRQLEVTWYGNQQAGPETFAETLTHLENLGCRR